MSNRLRCAIYTRKSSEEGLEQNFNSLHAQREACEAYVLSQTGEGWSAIKTAYDDGGFSGGSMERPGLKQLMGDITKGLVDIVVVYKVDRLTRSLADFAKIVELFDAKGVSFVSVTQAFNTTSSMGRLTLNVLLSFAQFEREVTGERIRDKVAASKAKGLRMGGRPPLGYDIVEGRLVVNPAEAPRVKQIFERYLMLGSVTALEREGVPGKRWSNKVGEQVGGGMMSRGALYYLLTSPTYRGITRHKDKRYADTHPAIINEPLWDAAQAKLGEGNASQPNTEKRGEGAWLQGILFDDRGNAMVPVHTNKGPIRYRYYISRAKLIGKGEAGSLHRIAAGMLEQFLTDQITPMLATAWRPDLVGMERILPALRRLMLGDDQIVLEAVAEALTSDAIEEEGVTRLEDGFCRVQIAFHMRRRQGASILQAAEAGSPQTAKVDRSLVRAIVLAKTWAAELERGELASIKALAVRYGLCNHYTARMLPLAYLSPAIVEQILAGRQPRAITLGGLTAQPVPIAWDAQQVVFDRLAMARD